MQRASELIARLVRTVAGIGLLASVLLICCNAFGRYVLLTSIIWAEEILGYALVWIVYLGAIVVTSSDDHLKMSLLTDMCSEKVRLALSIVGNIAFAAVGMLIVYQSFDSIAMFTFTSPAAGLPMNVVHSIIPVSFGAIVLLLLLQIVSASMALFGRGDETKGEAA